VAWFEDGTFVRTNLAGLQAWTNSPLLIVTALEATILEHPDGKAAPVSDLVCANLLQSLGTDAGWWRVRLPDGREGYVRSEAAQDYNEWRTQQQASPERIEQTARQFMGRPYLWGGNSSKSLDCSGFTQLVFGLNGVDLPRNSSQQGTVGIDVPIDAERTAWRTGDLLFFGRPARGTEPERIVHVGIYLRDNLFIHASECVQINSLDPASPIRDAHRIRTLLRVRRLL
jgi:hypothetical protein